MATIKLRKQLRQLTKTWEPEIRKAFMASVEELKSGAQLTLVLRSLERGDVPGAIHALHLDEAAFNRLATTLGQAYNAGGMAAVAGMPVLREPSGARLVLRWDVRNLRAEDWIRQHSSALITQIIQDQREMVRVVMTESLSMGINPRTTALDIVGRINKATGRREGGFIGLTTGQASAVSKARNELMSGDPALLQNYLGRKRRDKRFDSLVRKALAEGKPVPADDLAKMVGRYSDSLLQLRGETIARTETLASLNAAKHEAVQQGLAETEYGASDVVRIWESAGDSRVRDIHAEMDGQTVKGLDEPFQSPTGARLMHPGDTSLGAGAEDVINCRCTERIEIDFFRGRA